MISAELQELLDSPNETLGVEYKAWLDLTSPEVRADIARHIAAIANHGGGYIVFGFDDSTLEYVPSPFAEKIDRDIISSIVKKYLEPTFQCDVSFVISNAGNKHAIVTVPAHGATPICAKSNGPMDGKKILGIVQGQYYLRKAGPESAPIISAVEWSPVIRRCAMHDRAAIFGALDAALRGRGQQTPTDRETLNKWHAAAHAEFLNEVVNHEGCEKFARWNWQLSYSIDRADEQQLSHQNLLTTLREVNSEVRDLVKTGWSMFYVFDVPEISPAWQTDMATGMGEKDFLECALLKDTRNGVPLHPDMCQLWLRIGLLLQLIGFSCDCFIGDQHRAE
jgi:predicted HTH transcriptional regulator